jgi:hypothetical protein
MNYFQTPSENGVWQTFMGAIYFVFMLVGASEYRLPPIADKWMDGHRRARPQR